MEIIMNKELEKELTAKLKRDREKAELESEAGMGVILTFILTMITIPFLGVIGLLPKLGLVEGFLFCIGIFITYMVLIIIGTSIIKENSNDSR